MDWFLNNIANYCYALGSICFLIGTIVNMVRPNG